MPKHILREPNALTTGDLSKLLGVARGTVILWDNTDRLPQELRPARDGHGRRFWTADQAACIKKLISV